MINKGFYCIVNGSDQRMHRAKILKLENDHIKALFIDIGCTEDIPRNLVFNSSPENGINYNSIKLTISHDSIIFIFNK